MIGLGARSAKRPYACLSWLYSAVAVVWPQQQFLRCGVAPRLRVRQVAAWQRQSLLYWHQTFESATSILRAFAAMHTAMHT
jgi:hypothetical protein